MAEAGEETIPLESTNASAVANGDGEAIVKKALQEVSEAMQTMADTISKLRNKNNEAYIETNAKDDDQHWNLPPSALVADPKPVNVMVQLTVRRVFNVDMRTQTFGCQLLIRMLWRKPNAQEVPEEIEADWEPDWIPKYRFRRLTGEKGYSTHFDVREHSGVPYIQAEFDHILEIYETLDLKTFPVDTQNLGIELVSIQHSDAVKWVPWPDGKYPMVTLNTSLVELNDFRLVEGMNLVHWLGELYLSYDVSALRAQVKVVRKANFYILNVAVVVWLIVTAGLCPWGLHPVDVPGRQGRDFILILAAVVFKVVMAGMLPSTSYVTLLDVYVWAGITVLSGITVMHSSLPFISFTLWDISALHTAPSYHDEEDDMLAIDKIALYTAAGIWTGFNIVYFTYLLIRGKIVYNRFKKEALKEQETNNEEIKKMRYDLPAIGTVE